MDRRQQSLNIIPLDRIPKRERPDDDMVVETSEPPTPQPGIATPGLDRERKVPKTSITVEQTTTSTTITVKGKRFKLEVQKKGKELKIVM